MANGVTRLISHFLKKNDEEFTEKFKERGVDMFQSFVSLCQSEVN